jgi:hypothetical protein
MPATALKHGIGIQSVPWHDHNPAGDRTNAVVPADFESHLGNPLAVFSVNWTAYAWLTNRPRYGRAAGRVDRRDWMFLGDDTHRLVQVRKIGGQRLGCARRSAWIADDQRKRLVA